MKIEIGESLLFSYFKHVKKCLITQMNWKFSSNWQIDLAGRDQLMYYFNQITKHHEFSDIFKADLNQTLKQAEIDVIGINSSYDIFVAETAFHENGLQYGSKIETKNRVIRKILRALLTAKYLFPSNNIELIFSAPKVNNATELVLREYFLLLQNDFSDDKTNFIYLANDDFKNEIVFPTIKAATSENDTSELFLRSVKLLEMFDMCDISKYQVLNKIDLTTSNTTAEVPVRNAGDNIITNNENISLVIKDIKIPLVKNDTELMQDFVKRTLNLLFDNNLIPEAEINNLQNKEYCKQFLHLGFPLLQTEWEKCLDNTGRARYWVKELFGGKYYVCSQWWKQNEKYYLSKFSDWLKHLAEIN